MNNIVSDNTVLKRLIVRKLNTIKIVYTKHTNITLDSER